MILDSEVLLIDNKTGKPLPFGTLGVHKVRSQGQCARSVRVCMYMCVLLERGGIYHFLRVRLILRFWTNSELFLNLASSLDVFCFCLHKKELVLGTNL